MVLTSAAAEEEEELCARLCGASPISSLLLFSEAAARAAALIPVMSLPIIVKVLPLPVCPYAKTLALPPSKTEGMRFLTVRS